MMSSDGEQQAVELSVRQKHQNGKDEVEISFTCQEEQQGTNVEMEQGDGEQQDSEDQQSGSTAVTDPLQRSSSSFLSSSMDKSCELSFRRARTAAAMADQSSNSHRRSRSRGKSPSRRLLRRSKSVGDKQQHEDEAEPVRCSFTDLNPFQVQQKADADEASVGELEAFDDSKILPAVVISTTRADAEGEISLSVSMQSAAERDVLGSSLRSSNQDRAQPAADNNTAPPQKSHSVIGSAIESFKYLYSLGLLVFSLVIVLAAIFTKQTTGTGPEMNIHPALALVVVVFLISWLAMMEGGQGCLVGLQPIEQSQYQATHPRSYKCTTTAYRGDNLERFIVGRQFLVVLVLFVINLMVTAVPDANVFNMHSGATAIFLESGVAVILITITLGQLTAQVASANCMLDFINNYFMLFTTYVSLAIEWMGFLHAVYLIQILFCKLAGTTIESKEPPRSSLGNAWFWSRVFLSISLLGFAFAVTISALFRGKTAMWEGVPQAVSVVLLFLLMAFAGVMEGMQIALFAVVNMPQEELAQQNKLAYKTCQLVFAGQNLQAFLIGRQICVTVVMFVVARITTITVQEGEATILGVGVAGQAFFNTGLLGAVITTVCASLAWRVIASSFPVAFLSNPIVYIIVRLCLLLEQSGLCSAAWVIARYLKLAVGHQPDEVYLHGAEPQTAEPVTRRDKDIDRSLTVFKLSYSLGLLVFCVVAVVATIFANQTNGSTFFSVHVVILFCLFWTLIFALGMLEGGQGALVGLQPIEKTKYAATHPATLKNTQLAHRGDNLERFIVGRQFLVVLIVVSLNLLYSATANATIFGLSTLTSQIIVAVGIILITIVCGQLTSQINAANCMLDFINNYVMLLATYVSLAIEWMGFLHAVYLIRYLFAGLTGRPIQSHEPDRTLVQNVWFWGRVLLSLALLGFSMAVTISALLQGKTALWEGIPPGASVALFFALMCIVGILEGLQIALFAVVNLPEEELRQHAICYANCKLTFRGQNLQAVLIGRQVCVTIGLFLFARISTTTVEIGGAENLFGVSDRAQEFFNTGLLGAVITTVLASLAWRVIASTFPIAFLSNPLIYLILRLCLLVEASGVCSAAWVLGRWNKLLVGYQPDEYYLQESDPEDSSKVISKHARAPVTRRDKDIDVTVTVLRYCYSLALLVFCMTLAMALIFTNQTRLAQSSHSLVAFFVLWIALIWLSIMEGGQGCLLGLQPVDPTLYAVTHPVTAKITRLAYRNDNMERFIVGRQFLIVLVIFMMNLLFVTSLDSTIELFNLPKLVLDIFVGSGVAVILITVMIGQLTAQVNAANCMLDFINNYFMMATTYISLFVEWTGLLHAVYLIQLCSTRPGRNQSFLQRVFFWGRVLASLTLLGFGLAVTIEALYQGQTNQWAAITPVASVAMFVVLVLFVGMLEGTQIALLSVLNLPKEEGFNRLARQTCELTFRGSNLQAFLIGRQILVTTSLFVLARMTTCNVNDDSATIFGVSAAIQKGIFNSGLLGALVTTLVASLAWRMAAAHSPRAFLSANPLPYLIVRLCLAVEATSICAAAWLLALIHKSLVGYKRDEEYILQQKQGNLELLVVEEADEKISRQGEAEVEGVNEVEESA